VNSLPISRTVYACLRYNIAVLGADLVILGLLYSLGVPDISSLLMLAESGVLLTIGGLIDFSSSSFFYSLREHVFHSKLGEFRDEYKGRNERANMFVLLGILMLAETFVKQMLLG
jgi:hypothetical protein